MQQRERFEDREEALRVAFESMQRNLWTALPGIVTAFNAGNGTVSVQPAIKAKYRNQSGTIVDVTLPLLINVPVQAYGGGNFVLTAPIAAGDEVLVVFASRCIDAWWQQSNVQPQLEYRMHNLSDGFAIPGFRSVPKAVSNWSTENAQLRNTDGTTYLEIQADGKMQITAPQGLKIVGNVQITEDLQVDGELTAGTGGSSLNFFTHEHTNGNGGAPTGAPIPGT